MDCLTQIVDYCGQAGKPGKYLSAQVKDSSGLGHRVSVHIDPHFSRGYNDILAAGELALFAEIDAVEAATPIRIHGRYRPALPMG
jgi:hypothetical protein